MPASEHHEAEQRAADALRHATGATRVTVRTETRHVDGSLTVDGEAVSSEPVDAIAAREAWTEAIRASREPAPMETVGAAAHALHVLAADVESGGTRLAHYPAELPSLDELAAAVAAIEIVPTLSHDQLATFGRMAYETAAGSQVDANGACARLSIETDASRVAVVQADGETVARIAVDGTVMGTVMS